MKNIFEGWDVPPLIVEFKDGSFYVNDGRHRLEMYRQLGVKMIDVVLWTTGEENLVYLTKHKHFLSNS